MSTAEGVEMTIRVSLGGFASLREALRLVAICRASQKSS